MAKTKFDMNTPLGMAGGIWAALQLETNEKVPEFIANLDPKVLAAAQVFLGDWLPKQKFAKNALKNNDMRNGAGYGIQSVGVRGLMEEFGIAGVGATGNDLQDDDILAVAIEGDYYGDDEYDDDVDVINDDVLGEEYEDEDDDVIWE